MEQQGTIREDVISNFMFPGKLTEEIPYGSGHINDTFRLTFDTDAGRKRYILQRMNKQIFKNPTELMENVVSVTLWLRKKIEEKGGNPEREALNIVLARDGKPYYTDRKGEYWRAFLFVEGASCYDKVESPEDFYQSAIAFGNFQCLLADYPAESLHETIADFHNTAVRFEKFKKAVEEDVCGRAKNVQSEIRFVLEREALAHVLVDMQREGKLPLRVTHNDTKLNNIMIDDRTHKAICVLDLDTVMPGLAVNDFGDSIRFGASTAEEDEIDLAKVSCDLELFDIYTRGYIEGCRGSLTKEELDMLPMGAMVMTYECGMRFLTDYLEGDVYFKIRREEHNLDRCRTQFKLVKDMEEKKARMKAIVRKYGQV